MRVPVFPRDKREAFARRSCSNKKIERDDDSKKSHRALAGIGLKSPTYVSARNCLHQFADLGFQKIVRHDQRTDRSTHVATAGSDSLINSGLKLLLRVRLWIGREVQGSPKAVELVQKIFPIAR